MAMRNASCIVLILLGTLSQAIPASSADLLVGVKGGMNLANLTGDDVFNNSTSLVGIGGAFARYRLSEMFSLAPEVLFSMKGADFEAEGIETEQQFQYLEIPVLVRAAWRRESKLGPSLFGGPSLGILLDNKITDGAEIDLDDGSRSADFGVIVGAGLDYSLGSGVVLFDVRYERGLTSWTDNLDEKHSVASFMLGYGYRL